jgi:REP-associated tyrosine transposase
MSQTYSNIWLHIIWSTKYRNPCLTKDIRILLFKHIREVSEDKGFYLSLMNGSADHIHCLVSIKPNVLISKVVNYIKGESSHWINKKGLSKESFRWQRGYSVFSVSKSQLRKIKDYIIDQELHHSKITYDKEIELFESEDMDDFLHP